MPKSKALTRTKLLEGEIARDSKKRVQEKTNKLKGHRVFSFDSNSTWTLESKFSCSFRPRKLEGNENGSDCSVGRTNRISHVSFLFTRTQENHFCLLVMQRIIQIFFCELFRSFLAISFLSNYCSFFLTFFFQFYEVSLD